MPLAFVSTAEVLSETVAVDAADAIRVLVPFSDVAAPPSSTVPLDAFGKDACDASGESVEVVVEVIVEVESAVVLVGFGVVVGAESGHAK